MTMKVEAVFAVFSCIQLPLVNGLDSSKTPFKNVTRLINGKLADARYYRFMVQLSVNNRHQCAGVIVDEYWIMTAAHCLINQECADLVIIPAIDDPHYLTSGIQSTECYLHENFDGFTLANDIGLIKVSVNLLKSRQLQMVNLPAPGMFYPSNTTAIAAGWGTMNGDDTTVYFAQAVVYIGDDGRCKHSLQILGLYPFVVPFGKIPQETMCTYELFSTYRGICLVDSGGPILVNGILIGIIISGIDVAPRYACSSQIASIEVKVHDYLLWIYAYIDPYTSWNQSASENTSNLLYITDEERRKKFIQLRKDMDKYRESTIHPAN